MGKKTSHKHKLHLKNYQSTDEFGNWLGYKIEKLDRKNFQAIGSLLLRKDHLSPAGRIHGGVISSFFDFLCGATVFSTMKEDDFCSTIELKVHYFKPLASGDKLKGMGSVVFRGKRLCVVQSYMFRNKETEPVAMASATFNIVSK